MRVSNACGIECGPHPAYSLISRKEKEHPVNPVANYLGSRCIELKRKKQKVINRLVRWRM
jgi:hypothetical protein